MNNPKYMQKLYCENCDEDVSATGIEGPDGAYPTTWTCNKCNSNSLHPILTAREPKTGPEKIIAVKDKDSIVYKTKVYCEHCNEETIAIDRNDVEPRIWFCEECGGTKVRQLSLRSAIPQKESVNHPEHYNRGIEVIDIIESWKCSFCLGNVIKYVLRAPHKDKELEDLEKARWYLDREITQIEKGPWAAAGEIAKDAGIAGAQLHEALLLFCKDCPGEFMKNSPLDVDKYYQDVDEEKKSFVCLDCGAKVYLVNMDHCPGCDSKNIENIEKFENKQTPSVEQIPDEQSHEVK